MDLKLIQSEITKFNFISKHLLIQLPFPSKSKKAQLQDNNKNEICERIIRKGKETSETL